MKGEKVKIKGLATLTFIVFMHGFFDGRFKSAGIDQDSGILNSAYVNGKIHLFYQYCSERIGSLETNIAAVCIEAETLLMELEYLSRQIKFNEKTEENQVMRLDATKTDKENETLETLKGNRNYIQKRKIDIIQRLIQIKVLIDNKEAMCRNEINATAFALKERFCVYGHGVLLRPILNSYIPQMEYEWTFNFYNKNHDEVKRRISSIIKKEEM